MGFKIIASRSSWMAITSVTNFMKFYQAVQKVLVGDTQTETDTQPARLVIW
jgi:hypothetical protein